MKTLDEVIDYCEGKQTCGEWVGIADALHYLKEYRDLKSTMDWHEEMEEIRRSLTNDLLTWDELKQMEGKPVWIEYTDDEKQTGWALIAKKSRTTNIR